MGNLQGHKTDIAMSEVKAFMDAALPRFEEKVEHSQQTSTRIIKDNPRKQKSFLIRSSLLLAAFIAFSAYGKAQIKFESEEVKIEKFVPITDGSENMEFPHEQKDEERGPNGKQYDRSIPAQIQFYKAFIGQKILFYGDFIDAYNNQYKTFPRAVKRKIIYLPQPVTCNVGGKEYTVDKISTRMPYKANPSSNKPAVGITVKSEQFSKYGKEIPFFEAQIYGVMEDGYNIAIDKDIFNQFFVLKDVLTYEEADSLVRINSTQCPPTVYLPKIQKDLEKLEKKIAKKGELKGEDKTLYDELKNTPKYYTCEIGDETAYSQTIDNATAIDYEKNYEFFQSWLFRPTVWLVEDANGTEYLIYRTRGANPCITENHLNYLKENYVNQDFAELNNDGQIAGNTYRCEDLVIYKKELRAKCRNLQTQEVEYLELIYWQANGEMLWQIEDDDLNRYDIVVL